MSDHTAVALEVGVVVVAAYALSFAAMYVCLCRFIKDTGVDL
jgi:hypothetical protein